MSYGHYGHYGHGHHSHSHCEPVYRMAHSHVHHDHVYHSYAHHHVTHHHVEKHDVHPCPPTHCVAPVTRHVTSSRCCPAPTSAPKVVADVGCQDTHVGTCTNTLSGPMRRMGPVVMHRAQSCCPPKPACPPKPSCQAMKNRFI